MDGVFDSGTVKICMLQNKSSAGDMPVYRLHKLAEQSFEEQSISMTRAYLARGADEQVDMVIRIHDEWFRPRIGHYAVLTEYQHQENEAGDQFRITLVQPAKDNDGLNCFDLTLTRLEDYYDCEIAE